MQRPFILLTGLYLLTPLNAFGRLGETPKQIYDRYGGRVLWSLQVSGTRGLPEKCFLRTEYFPSAPFRPSETVARVGLIICYQTEEMDQIQVYYDRVTTNSIAEIFYPKLPHHVNWDGISHLTPEQEYQTKMNREHLEKAALLVGPKAANISDFEPCPIYRNSFFSKTAARVIFAYGAGMFGVAELGGSTECFLEYSKKFKAAQEDLKKANKY
jgi:hypothetical protein